MEKPEIKAIAAARRVASSEFVRRPGQMMEEVLRENLVVIQNHGRDVAALVDIKHFQSLVAALVQRPSDDGAGAGPCQ